jgi:hypothetical protein
LAAPVGRAALARRLVAGALDRSLDAAATLELRGYALPVTGVRSRRRPAQPLSAAFLVAGAAIGGGAIAARIAGVGSFDAFPSLMIELGAADLLLTAALLVAAVGPLGFDRARRRARAPAQPQARIAHA